MTKQQEREARTALMLWWMMKWKAPNGHRLMNWYIPTWLRQDATMQLHATPLGWMKEVVKRNPDKWPVDLISDLENYLEGN